MEAKSMRSLTMNAFSTACRCGRVRLEIAGAPMLHCIGYCKHCQEGGRRLQALAGADVILGSDGGTDYVVYRKDRVRCVVGGEPLEEYRLEPEVPTRRMNARCCNPGLFLHFTTGHSVSVYCNPLPGGFPPPTMRWRT